MLDGNRVRVTLPPLIGTELHVKPSATVSVDVLRCERPTSCDSLGIARSALTLELAR